MPRDRMQFIGVRTSGSSSMALFGRWAQVLGTDADLVGCDLPIATAADEYRSAVDAIAADPAIRGALVTTHKVGIFEAAADRFAEIDALARLCGEISCISKRNGRLVGQAKDPVTAGRALGHMLDAGHFARTGGHLVCLGAGGAGVAIAAHALTGPDRPARVILTDVSAERLGTARDVCRRAGGDPVTAPAALAHEVLATVPPGSLVVNATGMGKDVPGTPVTSFPRNAIVWELNYRGELEFLRIAREQAADRELRVFDGWLYFLHGWCEHMAQVFDIHVTAAMFERFRQVSDDWRARPVR